MRPPLHLDPACDHSFEPRCQVGWVSPMGCQHCHCLGWNPAPQCWGQQKCNHVVLTLSTCPGKVGDPGPECAGLAQGTSLQQHLETARRTLGRFPGWNAPVEEWKILASTQLTNHINVLSDQGLEWWLGQGRAGTCWDHFGSRTHYTRLGSRYLGEGRNLLKRYFLV